MKNYKKNQNALTNFFSNLSDEEFEEILDDAMPKTKDNKGSQ